MFERLTEKLTETFRNLRGFGKLTDENIAEALEGVKKALLEADVAYSVANDFIEKVRERAIGREVTKSLTPAQQVVKIVQDELTRMMGTQGEGLKLAGKPPVALMLVGLQGSGKTTTAAKLARFLKKKGRKPYLVPADIYRPAAIDQLKKLATQERIDCFDTQEGQDPTHIVEKARDNARKFGLDTLIIDTAGRLSIDTELMDELKRVSAVIHPLETLLVVDGMTGQDAVITAKNFHEQVKLTGLILTKMDGDARGGAALSAKAVANVPIKFLGTGEKLDGLEVFHPDRVAGRILEMGDILSLVEKAEETVNRERAEQMQEKLKRDEFTLEDFKTQLQEFRKLGSIEDTLKMIPGMAGAMRQIKGAQPAEKDLKRIEAIIDSMTPAERSDVNLLNASRRRRIALGSGTSVQDINRFVKHYEETRKMVRRLSKKGPKNFMRGIVGRMSRA